MGKKKYLLSVLYKKFAKLLVWEIEDHDVLMLILYYYAPYLVQSLVMQRAYTLAEYFAEHME